MQGLTDREKAAAIAAQGPGAGMCLALAELELYWENHARNAPDVHELRVNIRVEAGDRMAAVRAVADWLGVPVAERHGCYIAQRRFGTGADSVIIEAHTTPDQDRTYALMREAAEHSGGQDAPAELASVA